MTTTVIPSDSKPRRHTCSGQNADACFLTEHLQYLDDQRTAFWSTDHGGRLSEHCTYPNARCAFRARYPESGQFVNLGEDSVFLSQLAGTVPVVGPAAVPICTCSTSITAATLPAAGPSPPQAFGVVREVMARNEARIRETLLAP
jgi:hypothetical protein